MTDQLQRLRSDTFADLAQCDAEIARLHDKASVYRHMISRIDDMIAEGVIHEPETVAEKDRREKRDIRGAVVAVLKEYGPHEAAVIKTYAESKIGELSDSALARSLSSLVGDGSIREMGGVFDLPPALRSLTEAAK